MTQAPNYRISNEPGTPFALMQMDTERANPGSYAAPTDESRAKLAEFDAARKAAAVKRKESTPACPLVNPTDEDAERLQTILNERALAARVESYKRNGYSLPVTDCTPQSVLRVTQAQYSVNSKGSYAIFKTRDVFAGGVLCLGYHGEVSRLLKSHGRPVCMIRQTSGGGNSYNAHRVIILTDKPQKPLPAAVWAEPVAGQQTEISALANA